jgi:hypothetical protein
MLNSCKTTLLLSQAEAIIANPISYGHVSLADHLGLPLHFLWTQPETATKVTVLMAQHQHPLLISLRMCDNALHSSKHGLMPVT